MAIEISCVPQDLGQFGAKPTSRIL